MTNLTNCEVCGSRVKVVGNVTKHYEPLELEIENARLRQVLKSVEFEFEQNIGIDPTTQEECEKLDHKLLAFIVAHDSIIIKRLTDEIESALYPPSPTPLADAYKRLRDEVSAYGSNGVSQLFEALAEITKLEGDSRDEF